MTSARAATRGEDAARGPRATANAHCPACGSTRFGTTRVGGNVHAVCTGCDATYASVLDLVAPTRPRSTWLARLLGRARRE